MQAVPHRGQVETVQEKSGNGKRFTHFITSVLTNVFFLPLKKSTSVGTNTAIIFSNRPIILCLPYELLHYMTQLINTPDFQGSSLYCRDRGRHKASKEHKRCKISQGLKTVLKANGGLLLQQLWWEGANTRSMTLEPDSTSCKKMAHKQAMGEMTSFYQSKLKTKTQKTVLTKKTTEWEQQGEIFKKPRLKDLSTSLPTLRAPHDVEIESHIRQM